MSTLNIPNFEDIEHVILWSMEQLNTYVLVQLYDHYRKNNEHIIVLNMISLYLSNLLEVFDVPQLSDLATIFVNTSFTEEYKNICNRINTKIAPNPISLGKDSNDFSFIE